MPGNAPLFFAGLGAIGTGILLFAGPAPIAEEFPLHRQAGAGAGAFGALLLLLAFAGDAPAAIRIKRFLVAAASLGFASLLAAGVVPDAVAAWKLQREGVPATALVTGTKIASVAGRSGGRTTIRRAEIEYAGHRATLRISAARGQRIPVLYLPSEPAVVLPGEPSDPFIRLATGGRTWPWIASGLALLTAVFGFSCLASCFASRPEALE